MALFDYIGEGWTLTEALEVHREISGPDSQTSYQTEPLRVVPCDLALRWGLLIVSLLDETADFVTWNREWRARRLAKKLVRLVRRKPRIQLLKPSIGTRRTY